MLDYQRRLIYGKLVDKTLADVDYVELAPLIYGQEYSADVARRMMYGSCKTLQLIDADKESLIDNATPVSVMSEITEQRIELQKERQRFFDQRAEYNRVLRERARAEELNDIIVRTIRESNLPVLNQDCQQHNYSSDNDLLVSLNDMHFGADIDSAWCKYNSDVCAGMMAKYLSKIREIAALHHSQRCIVHNAGDTISGMIHHSIQVANKENVIEQVMGAAELIACFLAELSGDFAEVKYVSVAGNHSRIDTKDRALKDERLDDLIEWYLKARLANIPNIEIGCGQKIDSTMFVIDVRGKTYVGVHGDYDTSAHGVLTLQQMVGRPVYAVLMGHLHHNATNVVQGIHILMAGSFQGMDDYCVQRRIVGKPEQMVTVCDSSGIRCTYDIDLTL